jgi:DNA-binding response OmpR family regulator
VNRSRERFRLYRQGMVAPGTILCIHRDPSQLSLLEEGGYGLLTATNGSDGLRLLRSQSVRAVVLEYYLGLLNGAVVADEIKRARPRLPIVMVADHLELPEEALKSVDALVSKSDGPDFLLATIHAVLQTRQSSQSNGEANIGAGDKSRLRRTRVRERTRGVESSAPTEADENRPFSAELWKSILNGVVQF